MSHEEKGMQSWTIVTRRKRNAFSKNRNPKLWSRSSPNGRSHAHSYENWNREGSGNAFASPCEDLEDSDLSHVVGSLYYEVSRLKEQVESSKWWRDLSRLLISQGLVCENSRFSTPSNLRLYAEAVSHNRIVGKLICYGLGTFENSVISRYQLALAKLLQELCLPMRKSDRVDVQFSSCSVYDPVMSAIDTELCAKLGFLRLEPSVQHSTNSLKGQCCSIVSSHVEDNSFIVFFMPHCGRSLYNTVLKENWSRSRMSKVVILGNSFSFYQTFGSTVDADSYLGLASGWVKELKCPDAQLSPLYEAFNDLSVHMFPIEKLPREDDRIWLRKHLDVASE